MPNTKGNLKLRYLAYLHYLNVQYLSHLSNDPKALTHANIDLNIFRWGK